MKMNVRTKNTNNKKTEQTNEHNRLQRFASIFCSRALRSLATKNTDTSCCYDLDFDAILMSVARFCDHIG